MGQKLSIDNLIKKCQRFISFPGESGQEKEAATYLKEVMEDLGFDRVWIDDWGNTIGVIEGQGTEKILLQGHMDTVGVENQELWSINPYGGVIKDGKLYGRGTSDMRTAIMTMAFAAASFIPYKEDLQGDIIVAGTVHEEIFEGVAQGKVVDQVDPDLVIIGEATNLNLAIGQRGRAEIQVTTYGKSAHSANPQEGVNAVKQMMKFLAEVEQLELPVDDFLGEAILELTDIHSRPYPGRSVVPEECLATFDRRLLVGESEESVLAPLEEISDNLSKRDKSFKAEVKLVEAEVDCYTGNTLASKRFFPAWKYSQEDSFVKEAYQALQDSGLKSQISHYSFCTDGSQSAGIRQIPTIGFGPSEEKLAHVVDEYVELTQLEGAYRGYVAILKKLLAEDSNYEDLD
jgi:putative selenium metabolism hydrolase